MFFHALRSLTETLHTPFFDIAKLNLTTDDVTILKIRELRPPPGIKHMNRYFPFMPSQNI